MKKFILLAAAATMMVSCMETEKLGNDLRSNDAPLVIGFNTISEKATRATVENLEDYHNTFAVWATKKSNNDENANHEVVFCGDSVKDIISYDATRMAPNHWTYNPYRYWDKQATYSFVAVAPNANIVRYNTPANVADNGGTFVTVSNYTLIGQNLQTSEAPAAAEKKVGFTGGNGKDTDLMTSKKVTRNVATTTFSDVNMEFKHILAKLNVSIAKDPTFDNVKVIIDSVKVTGLDDTGVYFEATNNAASSWTSSLVNADYRLSWKSVDGVELPASTAQGDKHIVNPLYFIESLVMPQSIDKEVEKLTVDYRIISGDNTEKYNYVLCMHDSVDYKVFDSFMEKNNYTLKLTVKPNVITFDACSEVWINQEDEEAIVPPVRQ